jgi:hypothetical protein
MRILERAGVRELMAKVLRRIIAFLLVPCLITNPVLVTALSEQHSIAGKSNSIQTVHQVRFQEQAIAARLSSETRDYPESQHRKFCEMSIPIYRSLASPSYSELSLEAKQAVTQVASRVLSAVEVAIRFGIDPGLIETYAVMQRPVILNMSDEKPKGVSRREFIGWLAKAYAAASTDPTLFTPNRDPWTQLLEGFAERPDILKSFEDRVNQLERVLNLGMPSVNVEIQFKLVGDIPSLLRSEDKEPSIVSITKEAAQIRLNPVIDQLERLGSSPTLLQRPDLLARFKSMANAPAAFRAALDIRVQPIRVPMEYYIERGDVHQAVAHISKKFVVDPAAVQQTLAELAEQIARRTLRNYLHKSLSPETRLLREIFKKGDIVRKGKILEIPELDDIEGWYRLLGRRYNNILEGLPDEVKRQALSQPKVQEFQRQWKIEQEKMISEEERRVAEKDSSELSREHPLVPYQQELFPLITEHKQLREIILNLLKGGRILPFKDLLMRKARTGAMRLLRPAAAPVANLFEGLSPFDEVSNGISRRHRNFIDLRMRPAESKEEQVLTDKFSAISDADLEAAFSSLEMPEKVQWLSLSAALRSEYWLVQMPAQTEQNIMAIKSVLKLKLSDEEQKARHERLSVQLENRSFLRALFLRWADRVPAALDRSVQPLHGREDKGLPSILGPKPLVALIAPFWEWVYAIPILGPFMDSLPVSLLRLLMNEEEELRRPEPTELEESGTAIFWVAGVMHFAVSTAFILGGTINSDLGDALRFVMLLSTLTWTFFSGMKFRKAHQTPSENSSLKIQGYFFTFLTFAPLLLLPLWDWQYLMPASWQSAMSRDLSHLQAYRDPFYRMTAVTIPDVLSMLHLFIIGLVPGIVLNIIVHLAIIITKLVDLLPRWWTMPSIANSGKTRPTYPFVARAA